MSFLGFKLSMGFVKYLCMSLMSIWKEFWSKYFRKHYHSPKTSIIILTYFVISHIFFTVCAQNQIIISDYSTSRRNSHLHLSVSCQLLRNQAIQAATLLRLNTNQNLLTETFRISRQTRCQRWPKCLKICTVHSVQSVKLVNGCLFPPLFPISPYHPGAQPGSCN